MEARAAAAKRVAAGRATPALATEGGRWQRTRPHWSMVPSPGFPLWGLRPHCPPQQTPPQQTPPQQAAPQQAPPQQAPLQ